MVVVVVHREVVVSGSGPQAPSRTLGAILSWFSLMTGLGGGMDAGRAVWFVGS